MEANTITEIDRVLGTNGLIHQTVGDKYEVREDQLALSNLIFECLENDQSLIAEGPCGIGKSFAYLVPAIKKAVRTNSKVVIVTSNIALQEQLINKDLPFLNSVMPESFRFALIKGRNNFACKMKVEESDFDPNFGSKLKYQDKQVLERVLSWAKNTRLGDKSELEIEPSQEVWDLVSVSDEDCKKRACDFYEECHTTQNRKTASEAHVIVCNYHIFLIDRKVKNETENKVGILPQFDYAIFDEGHKLEEYSRSFFGEEVSRYSIRRVHAAIKDIGSYFKRRPALTVLMKTDARITKANKFVQESVALSDILEKSNNDFFDDIESWYKRQRNYVRTKQPNIVDYRQLVHALASASALLEGWAALLNEAQSKDWLIVQGRSEEAGNLADKVQHIIAQTYPGYSYKVEVSPTRSTKISAEPIYVSDHLHTHVWSKLRSSILVSATLALGGALTPEEANDRELALASRFQFNINTLGLDPGIRKFVCDSPFDFMNNCALVICGDFPLPVKQEKEYRAAFRENIQKAILEANGGALILFTSYDHMNEFYANCGPLEKAGLKVYCQGSSQLNRTKLVEAFKKDVNSVLLGTASFWEGVDIPGDALRLLVIDKIPFPNKSQDSFLDAIEELNPRSFMEEYVPRSIIKLKQGVGRLIRTKSDKGLIIIADRRVHPEYMGYSKKIYGALPPMPWTTSLDVVKGYFEGLREKQVVKC